MPDFLTQRKEQLQAQMIVGAANDKYEQEADAVARRVVSSPAPAPFHAQRKCASCDTTMQTKSYVQRVCKSCDEKMQAKSLESIQRNNTGLGSGPGKAGGTVNGHTSNSVERMRKSGGRPMEKNQRDFFESRMGHDFSDVRLHVGPEAARTSKELGAKAYTIGRDIAFGEGQYQPGSTAGKELLAHELTHTVQQGATRRKVLQAKLVEPGKDKQELDDGQSKVAASETIQAPVAEPRERRRAEISVSLPSERKAESKASKTTPQAEVGSRKRKKNTEIILPSQKAEQTVLAQEKKETDADQPVVLQHEKVAQVDAGTSPGSDGAPSADGAPTMPMGTGPADPDASAGSASAVEPGGIGAVTAPPPAAKPFKITANEPGAILRNLEKVPPSQAAGGFNQARRASSAALAKQASAEQAKLPVMKAPTGLAPGRKKRRRSWRLGSRRAPGIASGASRDLRGRRMDTAVHLPADGRHTPTSLGRRPGVDMSGAANTAHLGSAQARANKLLRRERNRARSHANQNFGEKDVRPRADHTVIGAKAKIKKPAPSDIPSIEQGPIDPQMAAALDKSVGPDLSAKISEQRIKGDQAAQDAREKTAQAHKDADEKIQALKQDASAKQEKTIQDAGHSVNRHKTNYRNKLSATERNYRRKAAGATRDQKRKINTRRRQGEKQAAQHFARAEGQARKEKNKALGKVHAKEKEKEKGFLNYVGDAAKAFVRGLQKAINFIFDNLRKAVKWLFEQAKKLAVAAIERARSAIVTLIKVFGFVLKKIVGWYFRDVPWLAKKFQKLIDGAVRLAETAVNAIAAGLKKAVTAVLDLLAKAVDWVLELYQKIYNGILDVVYLLVSGNFAEIWKRLGHLGSAAAMAPSLFEQAAMEELTGSNLDEPLDPLTLKAAHDIKDKFDFAIPEPAPMGPQIGDRSSGGSSGGDSQSSGPRPPWTDKNVGVEPVHTDMQLHPDVLQEARLRAGPDGVTEFGETQDSDRSMEAVLAESREGKAQGQSPLKATDGLTPKQRGTVRWEVMKAKLWKFLDDYKWWIAAGAVVAIAAIAAALIFSGGTILAALPGLMAALTKIFLAVSIAVVAVPLTKYLELGWQGKIRPAAKEMARSWALLAIELISWLTFKAGGAILKGGKTLVVGAARGIKTSARLGRLAAGGSRYFIRGSKVVFRSVKRSFFQGVRRLRVMGKMLMRRLRFRKFRIRFAGRRFFLEGKVNPWVLILTGNVDLSDASPTELKPGQYTKVSGKGNPKRGDLVYTRENGQLKRAIYLDDSTRPTSLELDSFFRKHQTNLTKVEREEILKAIEALKKSESTRAPIAKIKDPASSRPKIDGPDPTGREQALALEQAVQEAARLGPTRRFAEMINLRKSDIDDIVKFLKERKSVLSKDPWSRLIKEEQIALHVWTKPGFSSLQSAIRLGAIEELRKFRALLDYMIRGLRRLDDYKGTVYRILNEKSMPVAYRRRIADLKVGDEFHEPAFSAAHRSMKNTLRPGRTVFKIKSKTGKDIAGISRSPLEGEILLLPGRRFEVIARYPERFNGRGYSVIEMIEL